jgi:uncharacterized protein YcbK (DUF882 family)
MSNTTNDWTLARDFTAAEFVCKHCGKAGIRFEFVQALQALRDRLGVPLRITSGYRCPQHPVERGKAKPGRHAEGIAADITGPPLIDIWRALADFPEFAGVGVARYQNYIHIDTRGGVPPGGRVVWAYDRGGRQVKWSGKWEELP